MKKFILILMCCLSLLIFSNFSSAATNIINSKIIDVVPDKNYQVIYIQLESPQTGETDCVLNQYQSTYQINELGTPISDALLSVALTALATGKPVKAVGNGRCDGREGIETLRLIEFAF